ncbi:hypothetical protein NQ315_009285 [Exocentrus adspersus]|uniref:Uncharacterized protein n=1 Tax=Exocentrus adspersus TaxID=1586481 RepID=A0AAV8WGI8_9CUCU|nr:hypothetical protein NQ315_009285 [Exocentrus adspersus]
MGEYLYRNSFLNRLSVTTDTYTSDITSHSLSKPVYITTTILYDTTNTLYIDKTVLQPKHQFLLRFL